MLAFPSMIEEAARKAGMKVPDDLDEYPLRDFPHWFVFCQAQLGRRCEPGEHWENAKVVAAIPDDEITEITIQRLIDKGFRWSS